MIEIYNVNCDYLFLIIKNTSLFFRLISERHEIENKAEQTKRALEAKVCQLQEELETAKRQVLATVCGCEAKKGRIDEKIDELEKVIRKDKKNDHVSIINDKIRRIK